MILFYKYFQKFFMKKILLTLFILSFTFFWMFFWIVYGADTSWTGACESDNSCLDQADFEIDTSTFSPWGTEFLWQWTAKETINLVLGTIVRRLIVALWIISLLIMSIGAWFMILYWEKDENLTKWKTILKMWFVALFIALSSYTIISIVIFILYH